MCIAGACATAGNPADGDPSDASVSVPDAPPNNTPDASQQPDASPGSPDATPPPADATPGAPDALLPPDAIVLPPDAMPPPPDAMPPPPDAMPPPPDAGVGVCTENATLTCGLQAGGSLFSAVDQVSGHTCSTFDTTTPDRIYRYVAPNSGTVTATLDVIDDGLFGDDMDLYILTPTCDPATCYASGTAIGDESVNFSVGGGQTYYIVIELYAVGLLTFQDFTLTVSCP